MESSFCQTWRGHGQEEKDFILDWKDITDFKRGLTIPSKLLPKIIKGGTVLVSTTYKMT